MNTSSRSSLHNHQPVTDELGRDVPQLKSYSKSLKGSLGSLYNLNQRQLLGSNSALAEWNYVMSQSNNGSSAAPSVVDRASVSGYSYATKKTARGGAYREPTFQGVFRPKFIKREASEVYCVKFSPDDEFIAAGLGNSFIQIYSTSNSENVRTLVAPSELEKELYPCTSIAFRPDCGGYKNKNVLVAGYADGRIIHWHYTSGQLISTVPEPNVQINCVTYQSNLNSETAGAYFASSGSDSYVRVYDSQNHKKLLEMNRGQGDISAGHSSRVFSVRFHPTEQNILISGGWDNTIQFWDTRIGHSVRSIYGPHICGSDSLDFNQDGSEILTASFAKEDQLQMWDFGSGKLIDTIAWSIMEGERKNSLLYSGSFGKSKAPGGGVQYAIAGGCGGFNEVKLFNLQTKRAVGVAQGFTHSVYSVVMSSNEKMIAVGGGFKAVYAYDVDMHQQTSELIY
ncbi:WD40 repeat-like protein [Rhizoclosmatium globosum]|uniref:WD40 repeat-like protein n=1 Tax=Rhizoclosmatium globosum TaxID=329046 RepID=A0A1Y2CDG8_9FUNG|nr:WD40 repeat-like protein [Rhizoclosmatium globosum]|eukprot:ORY44947.1 WD40 repeat-like protein [Rhizoclosmatium globosum]